MKVVQTVADLPVSNKKTTNMLVLSDDSIVLDTLVNKASSFSISLGE